MANGIIFDIKEFAIHDGPGIRITVFFKGCPLNCNWCHNPEGISFKRELMVKTSLCTGCGKCKVKCSHPECQGYDRCLRACPKGLVSVVGKKIESKELANKLLCYSDILQMNNGGITISGGEPLAQPSFLLELLREVKPLHTVIETSGYGKEHVFKEAIDLTDLILFDIKHMNSKIHEKYTGVKNEIILRNLQNLIESDKPFIVRIPLIPKVTDTNENLKETASVLEKANNLIRVELLPYNIFAGAKYSLVKRKYEPKFDVNAPINCNCNIFKEYNIKCIQM